MKPKKMKENEHKIVGLFFEYGDGILTILFFIKNELHKVNFYIGSDQNANSENEKTYFLPSKKKYQYICCEAKKTKDGEYFYEIEGVYL